MQHTTSNTSSAPMCRKTIRIIYTLLRIQPVFTDIHSHQKPTISTINKNAFKAKPLNSLQQVLGKSHHFRIERRLFNNVSSEQNIIVLPTVTSCEHRHSSRKIVKLLTNQYQHLVPKDLGIYHHQSAQSTIRSIQ
jgi:hypothetical protein